MHPQMSVVYPLVFLSLYVFQGLLQNVYLVFENSIEDLLSKKGCQQNQGGRCLGSAVMGPPPRGRALEGRGRVGIRCHPGLAQAGQLGCADI